METLRLGGTEDIGLSVGVRSGDGDSDVLPFIVPTIKYSVTMQYKYFSDKADEIKIL